MEETNWRRIIIYVLILITVIAIVVALVLANRLSPGPSTTPTPTPSVSVTTSPTPTPEDQASCSEKSQTVTSIKCRRDDSTVCPNTVFADSVQNAMVGVEICGNTDQGRCAVFESCAPKVKQGDSCTANYSDISDKVRRLSSIFESKGSFVGCDANNQINNCFCGESVDEGKGFTTGTVTCSEDEKLNGFYGACGARSFAGEGPSPTVTPSGSVTVTPTVSATTTVSPTLSETPTVVVTTPVETTTAPTTVTPTVTLVDTAIIDDSTDRLLLALILIFFGIIIYVLDIHKRFEKLIKENIVYNIPVSTKEIDNDRAEYNKKKFEKRIRKE